MNEKESYWSYEKMVVMTGSGLCHKYFNLPEANPSMSDSNLDPLYSNWAISLCSTETSVSPGFHIKITSSVVCPSA